MADTAAHLVDHVLPSAPYRPWVLSLPKLLRLRLARHPAWTTWVGGLIVRAIAPNITAFSPWHTHPEPDIDDFEYLADARSKGVRRSAGLVESVRHSVCSLCKRACSA
jgi:hypothetical protein